jgi:hypothetical protein
MRFEVLLALPLALVTTLPTTARAQDPAPAVQPTPAPAPAAAPVPSQESVLRIYEKGKGTPLSKVEIKLGETTLFSDPKGEARLVVPSAAEAPDGAVRLFRVGYETLVVPYSDLRPAGEFDIYLFPAVSDENVIVVTGKRRPQVSRKTISIEESRRIAPGGDPAQVVKLLPGVQTSGFRSDVVVRGSGPRDSRYYIDDLEVPFIFHGIGNLSVVPAPLMAEVQFDAGGFGPEYGDATGGVIVIRTKNEIPERPATEFVVNVPFYSGILHTRPLSEDSSLTVSVRRSYVEYFINKFLETQADEAGSSLTLVPYFGDMHAVYLKKGDTGHTKVTALAAYDGVLAAVPTDDFADEEGRAEVEFRTSFVNLGVERYLRLDQDWKMTTTPQLYYFETNADFVGNAFGLRVTNLRAPTEFSRRLGKNEELVLGLDPVLGQAAVDVDAIEFREGDPTFDPEEAPRRRVTQKYPYQSYAAWVSVDKELGDTIVTPGVRAFHYSLLRRTSADPRIRARHALTPSQTLKAAVGQFSQSPEPSTTTEEFGNTDLDFTRSIHYVLGLETKWGDDWTTEVQGFYKTAKSVVTPNEETRYDNEGSFRSRGAELFVRRNLTGRLFGWLSYTYSKTEVRDSDSEDFRDSEYDQTHVVNAVGSYRLTAQWELGSRYAHHTGDTYTPTTDAVYNVNLDKYQERNDPTEESSKRLPSFNSLTLYATKDFLFDTWKMLLKFGMESYWPKTQVLGVGNNYDYTKETPQNGLTAIPFLEVRGEL